MNASIDYISCGINPTRKCADWSERWLAIGAHNTVVLCEIYHDVIRARHLLRGHKGRVNCVSWINDEILVSGSVDHTVNVWHIKENDDFTLDYHSVQLEGHMASVSTVTALEENGDIVIATSSGDCTIRVWRGQFSKLRTSQTIRVPQNEICLCLKLCFLSRNIPLMLTGTSSGVITIYLNDDNAQFSPVSKLRGHSDWIISLDCVSPSESSLLIASGSQDKTVRIWKIESLTESNVGKDVLFHNESFQFASKDKKTFGISLETVLTGHDEAVSGVLLSCNENRMRLLTVSKDKSLILWHTDDSGLWIETVQVGEVGGNSLGLLDCCIFKDGKTVIAYGMKGGVYAWRLLDESRLQPFVAITGHTGSVSDVTWQAKEGSYILSTGREDQTCRLHAQIPVFCDSSQPKVFIWHENYRTQIHGYDLTCVASLNQFSYASASEEKSIRIFSSMLYFKRSERDSEIEIIRENVSINDGGQDLIEKSTPVIIGEDDHIYNETVYVPALGLSNKVSSNSVSPQYSELFPTEDNLSNATLWPESRKLYGLGNEVVTLDVNTDGTILAAASSANSSEQAVIMVWLYRGENKWSAPVTLKGHNLTVTELRFAPFRKNLLLSVSRDRKWRLWQNNAPESSEKLDFELLSVCPKSLGHSRIIWACAWSFDEKFFFTASRDKRIIAWNVATSEMIHEPYVASEAVTALDCALYPYGSKNLLCAGLEDGAIVVLQWSCRDGFVRWNKLSFNQCHNGRVNKIRFRPFSYESWSHNKNIQFVSAGEDHLLLIHSIEEEEEKNSMAES